MKLRSHVRTIDEGAFRLASVFQIHLPLVEMDSAREPLMVVLALRDKAHQFAVPYFVYVLVVVDCLPPTVGYDS